MKLIAIAVLVSSAHGYTSNDGIKLCNVPDAATCSANNLCGANGQCTDYSSDTGWVKVMQASAGDNTFRYTHDVWTTSNTYGSANDGTFKNAQFNTLKTDKVKVCTNNDAKCYTYNLPSAWGKLTMLELTSGSHRKAADMDMAAWEDVMGNTNCGSYMCAKNGCTMQNPGFNTHCNDGNKARFGFCDNIPSQECQPGDNQDSDRAIGIGLAGQSGTYASAGVQGYSSQDQYGTSLQFSVYISTSGPSHIYGMYDYSSPPGGGWDKVDDIAEFNSHKAEFIAYYNANGGIPAINKWTSSNCCWTLRSGRRLYIQNTSGEGYLYPHQSDERCNGPEYSGTFKFSTGDTKIVLNTLSSDSSFTEGTNCLDRNNPAIYWKLG